MHPRAIQRRVNQQFKELPFSKATVKQDVPRDVVMYIEEREEDFPGVEVDPVFLREYPHGELGAHLFGYVGEVSQPELDDPSYSGVQSGDRVGKAGLEAEYDQFLRGTSGATRVRVDALGNLRGYRPALQPKQGSQLRLSLDLDVQRAGQEALASGTGKGAFAVMDIHNGEVLGLGSQPSYDPNLFAKVVRQSDYDRLTDKENGDPLTNRAVASGYPTGSTFKLITATAALESGLITPDTPLNDPGELKVGDVTFKNAGGVAHGVLSLRQALTVSSDVFFYQLGRDLNDKGMPLQHWARELGLGRRTGIDLPEEGPGFIPGPKWRDRQYAKFQRCVNRTNPTPTEISLGKCGWQDRPWSVGDNVNLAVGQGDVPGRPAPDGGRLRARSPTAGGCCARGSGQRIENSAGQAEAGPRGADGPQAEHRAREPLGDPRRPARRRQRPRRHLDAGVLDLPRADRRQDRNGREGSRPRRPVLVRRAGALARPQVRGRRDRRGRRLRRRHRRADGAPHPGGAVQRERAAAGPGRRPLRLMATTAVQDFRDTGPRLLRLDPLLLLATFGLIFASVYTVHKATLRRHPGRPELLHGPPADLHRRRGGADAAGLALRLLAPARMEARRLRRS